MKIMGMAIAIAAVASLAAAQSSQTTTETKVDVKNGTDVKVTGCIARDSGGTGFMLTNVADKNGAMHNYVLVTDDKDVPKHMGHRVEIEGRVTDRGDGKVKVETKTETKVEHGEDQETRGKAEIKGDGITLPYLGVKSVKMIAASCP